MNTLCFWLISLVGLIYAQSSFSPIKPPSIPLAVRSPYLSTWTAAGSDGGNGGYLAGQWPSFLNGATTGWTGLIRVDGKTYTWMGNPDPLPTLVKQTAFSYTSTRSVFTMDVAGLVTMEVSFLSPITPHDMLRQSAPVSYLCVAVHSADGKSHDVSLYSDISAEWASGDRSSAVQWAYGTAPVGKLQYQSGPSGTTFSRSDLHIPNPDTDERLGTRAAQSNVAYHKVWTKSQLPFYEGMDQASWGYWYYSTSNVKGLTHQSGEDSVVRTQFINHGVLANTADSGFRAIDDRYPVFGYAVNLGAVGATPVETVFTINLMQNKSVLFTSKAGAQGVPSFWTSWFANEVDAVTYFYNDYRYVAGTTTTLDNQVKKDSTAAGGANYVTLTSLAARQAWGGLQLCGTPSHPLIFLKEISSDGDIQTGDVIFPFIPIMLYMNPSWLKLVLDPLFINQETPGLWPELYAIHDLGGYPQAVGHPGGKAEYLPVEETGDMLIMTLAYAQKTGDTGYLSQHYGLLSQWTEWLVNNNSVIPFNQASTDDFAGPLANQTNLALKAIIGVQAGALMATMTGHAQDGAKFTKVAQSWSETWQQLGIASKVNPPHTMLSYGQTSTWGLLYNLYADALLHTNIIPKSVYQMQSNFYPTVKQKYGVPLDVRHLYTKNDWELFCAAIAAPQTRDMFISDVANWVQQTPESGPVTDLYEADSGTYAIGGGHFRARPVVGGWFSLLALNQTGIPQY